MPDDLSASTTPGQGPASLKLDALMQELEELAEQDPSAKSVERFSTVSSGFPKALEAALQEKDLDHRNPDDYFGKKGPVRDLLTSPFDTIAGIGNAFSGVRASTVETDTLLALFKSVGAVMATAFKLCKSCYTLYKIESERNNKIKEVTEQVTQDDLDTQKKALKEQLRKETNEAEEELNKFKKEMKEEGAAPAAPPMVNADPNGQPPGATTETEPTQRQPEAGLQADANGQLFESMQAAAASGGQEGVDNPEQQQQPPQKRDQGRS